MSDEQALAETVNWENEVNEIRAMIASELPGAENRIEIQVGEYNWSWRTANGYPGWNGDDRFYNSIATVWGASVAGHIAKAGGRGHQYADLNGAVKGCSLLVCQTSITEPSEIPVASTETV